MADFRLGSWGPREWGAQATADGLRLALEARVPLLDHKLVEFALAIPPDVKYRNGVTKWVLKRVAERVGLAASTISALERGVRRRPYLHTRQWLAEALGLSKAEQAAFVAQRPVARAAGAEALPPSPPAHTNLPAQRTPLQP